MIPRPRAGQFGVAQLCEDIRIELHGKHSLIGVLAGDLHVADMPAFMRMGAYFQYSSLPGHHDVHMRLSFDGTTQVITQTVFESRGLEFPAVIIIPPGNFQIDRPGVLKIDAQTDGGKWQTILSRNVSKAPTPLPL